MDEDHSSGVKRGHERDRNGGIAYNGDGQVRFHLDFAPHLGFPTPRDPLFSELAESSAPVAQIAFAAARGFKRVQDPFAAQRGHAEQLQIGAAAKAAGLGLGCFVYAPINQAFRPAWGVTDELAREALATDVYAAIEIGNRIGSKHIAILTGDDRARSHAEQMRAMTDNLVRLAEPVAAAGMMLCVEAVNAHRLPDLLLHHLRDAISVVRDADHPAVRLIFDTAHVQAMDGDILGQMDAAWDLIELIQLADHPDRVEPGAGELNFLRIIDEIERRGFAGPVELEHGWASPGPEPQRRYLQWLERWASSEERNENGATA